MSITRDMKKVELVKDYGDDLLILNLSSDWLVFELGLSRVGVPETFKRKQVIKSFKCNNLFIVLQ